MYLDFPTKFKIDYPEENATYYDSENTEMRYRLLEVCEGYCMYCGCILLPLGSSCRSREHSCHYGELEHTVEKSQPYLALFAKRTKKKYKESFALKHCKYNMGLACPICNRKRKKATAIIFNDIQPFRIITGKSSTKKNKQKSCSLTYHTYIDLCKTKKKGKCSEPCGFLVDCEKRHEDLHKIIRMPRNDANYKISYDYIEGMFIPHEKHKNNRCDFNLVTSHIEQFELNKINSGYVAVKDIAQVLKSPVPLNVVEGTTQAHVLGNMFIKSLKNKPKKHRRLLCKYLADEGNNPRKKKSIMEI